ncbi:hypothetical protein OZN62_11470 [Aurantiacibacter sp. MUD11]|uniref:hypothetical protein n=1 Tax=Aurantiacibacter sp. MUD11 TaxID=3003265 RepID=UPI0022AA0FCC|nr:hypothetical protein [Aurantiacibacter sp. MUD11]WAT17532.1 hypothetical protein OZN62_11470 [Aurantiacibacter sp. MUD11]
MNHLESLISEYLEWQGYLIRRNTKVGRLAHGGWAMELDVVGYDPHNGHLVHYEPSTDALSWAKREERFKKKFERGREYILAEIFTWLPQSREVEQIAICAARPHTRTSIAGAKLMSIDEFVAQVRNAVKNCGPARRNAISETFPLLRTLQLSHCGYQKAQ